MDYSHVPCEHVAITINSLLRSVCHGLEYSESPQLVDDEMTTWDRDDDGEDVEGGDDDGENLSATDDGK